MSVKTSLPFDHV